jgi:hypothetical protein
MNFKHMLFRAASALLLVSGLGFAGCDDADPDAFLSVTRQEIEVEYTGLTTEGEMVNFDLGTNRSWRASYVEEWIHLTHTEGDRGRVRIFLSIDENNTGEDRTGFIIFEGDGGTRRTIAVTQKLKVDALSVTPAKICSKPARRLRSSSPPTATGKYPSPTTASGSPLSRLRVLPETRASTWISPRIRPTEYVRVRSPLRPIRKRRPSPSPRISKD